MPNNYTSTTFSEVYKDDYSDSAGYYKVLFNSGRPLQARELTQLQTILQTQIQRMANNLFLDGAAVEASGGGVQTADYVVVESFSGLDVQDYVGQILQGPATADTSGLQFHVLYATEATDDGDDPTLYISISKPILSKPRCSSIIARVCSGRCSSRPASPFWFFW
jgi:hypothetical protein